MVIDSSQVGLRKPDPGIYRELVVGLGKSPELVLFVDDLSENLEPAREMGMRVVHFTGESDLRDRLRALGVHL